MREMKDSGIDRISLIPNHWSVPRLKHIFSEMGSGTTPSSGKEMYYENGEYYWIQSGDLYKTKYIIDTEKRLSELAITTFSALKEYKADFLVIAMYGASIGNVSISKINARTNQACCAIKPKDSVDLLYLYYVLCADKDIMLDMSVGGTQPNISQAKIMELPILMPPKEEQMKIATYLDKKCSEIDSLTADIQSQIETLEEYKRSVITEAVTKGLDPDVEMKDSGIAWVGDIPAHWITHPLYFYFGERKNKNALGLETNLLSLSYGKIIRKDINSNGGLLPESFNTYNIIEKDDIIIRPTDLQNDKRSLRTGISREHGIITSAYIAMKAQKTVNPEYFHYLLHAYDVMKVFYNMGNGVRQGLNFSEFSRLMVFEPTIEEQNAIVAYLKEKCDEIDLAIAEKKQQIETIEEYKKSLIFEYVTGKKEVTQ